jgi:uncharacterized protein (DUF433 family)
MDTWKGVRTPSCTGTRILADTIVQDAELGSPLEEIQENYPDLSLTAIQQLISFAGVHREQSHHPWRCYWTYRSV